MIGESSRFVMFGPAHLTAVALTGLVAAALIVWSRRGGEAVTRRVAWAIAVVLVLNEMGTWYHSATYSGWENLRDYMLPFHLCGVAVFLVAWALIRPNWLVFEMAYFWGLAGTLMGVITPNLTYGFPSYDFVRFFLNHSGIVIGVLFAALAMGQRPRRWAVLRVWLLTHVLMGVVALVNLLLGPGANYMFLRKPPGPLVDVFHVTVSPPWHILVLEPVALVMFSLLYLPFFVARRRHRAVPMPEAPAVAEPPTLPEGT